MIDLVWIGGPAGIGKSSLTDMLQLLIGGKIIKVEELILEIARREFPQVTIPELKTKDWKKWEKLWVDRLIDTLCSSNTDRYFVETHYAVPHPTGYKAGFNSEDLVRIHVSCPVRQFAFFLVLSSQELLKRRLADRQKPYRVKDIVLIEEEIEYKKKFFELFANDLKRLQQRDLAFVIEVDGLLPEICNQVITILHT